MRRLIILGLLYGGMELLLPLGSAGHGGQRLLIFGFLILAAYTIGEFATELRQPKIIGYLMAGVLFGPSVLGVVTSDAVERLRPFSAMAIALIAFLAGSELRWQELRARAVGMGKIVTTEVLLTFLAMSALMLVLGERVSFLQGRPFPAVLAFALLFASIVIVHSPAVTMALLAETKATGPVARTTLGVVLMSDVVVVLLFSCMLAIARVLSPPSVSHGVAPSLASVVWEILGAVLVGALLGCVVSLYVRFVRRELFLVSVVVAVLGSALARAAHVEVLLMMIVAGFISENLSYRDGRESIRFSMERAAAPVFVVFFALAGAQISLIELAAMWTLVLPIVAVRMMSIWAGTRLGARWANAGPEGRKVWLGLVSQAGVAIGLASVVAAAYPARGAQVRTLFLAVIAINEVLGAALFRHALVSSGEVQSDAVGRAKGPIPASGQS